MLGFLTPQDQIDVLVEPGPDNFVESDGVTVWLVNGDERMESITTANVLQPGNSVMVDS